MPRLIQRSQDLPRLEDCALSHGQRANKFPLTMILYLLIEPSPQVFKVNKLNTLNLRSKVTFH
ncbi:hypothetical protein INR49_003937 [Caranx melampygus]|nr:hypothetical protein INR49_003937 [Caranx melampygus]